MIPQGVYCPHIHQFVRVGFIFIYFFLQLFTPILTHNASYNAIES